jgi:hypothetical protein
MKPHILFAVISLFVASKVSGQSSTPSFTGLWKVMYIDTKNAKESMQLSLKTLSPEDAELVQMGYDIIEQSILENVSKLYFKLNEDGTYKAFMPDYWGNVAEDNGTYKMNFPFTLEFNSTVKQEAANTLYIIVNATSRELILQEEEFKFKITLQQF